MPSIESLHRRAKDGSLSVLTVNVGEEPRVVRRFMRENGYTFPVLLDRGLVTRLYGVKQHPMKFLIGPKGELLAYSIGYRQWDVREMDVLARKLAGDRTP